MGLAYAELQKQHTEMERRLEVFCRDQAAALQELCMVRCVPQYGLALVTAARWGACFPIHSARAPRLMHQVD